MNTVTQESGSFHVREVKVDVTKHDKDKDFKKQDQAIRSTSALQTSPSARSMNAVLPQSGSFCSGEDAVDPTKHHDDKDFKDQPTCSSSALETSSSARSMNVRYAWKE
jgi:hypothetical protein